MNRSRLLPLTAAAAALFLLGGCVSTAPAQSNPPHTAKAPKRSSAETSDTESPTPLRSPESAPSQSALMICGSETQANIAQILSLATPPLPVTRWADQVFTCTYPLAEGPLILSVTESTDPAGARAHFTARQDSTSGAQTIDGLANLGLSAYQTTDGLVSFVKDNMTLEVDATQAGIGQSAGSPSRTHVAYQIATAILACWTGK